jgi:hypothetical protein
VAQSTAHSFGVAFDGDFGALTRGEVRLDYRDQTSPQAAAGGQSYQGLAGSLSLSRQLSPSALLTLIGRRATDLSAFEGNAFYVSTGGQATFSFGLPWSLSANTGLGYQENQYQTIATEIGVPREDSILGWTVGLRAPGTFAPCAAIPPHAAAPTSLVQLTTTLPVQVGDCSHFGETMSAMLECCCSWPGPGAAPRRSRPFPPPARLCRPPRSPRPRSTAWERATCWSSWSSATRT